ncbi:hypothetical protein V6Z12_A13G141800 [Gossypium hirsutum]
MEAKYVATSEATNIAIWLRKFLTNLVVIPSMEKAITLYCDNSATIANTKEMRSYKRSKYIYRKYHLIQEAADERIVDVVKVASEDNLADPFTKTLVIRSFNKHVEHMRMQNILHLLH